MSLAVLKYIASKGGKVDVDEIESSKSELDDDNHFYMCHNVPDSLEDLYRAGLIKGTGAVPALLGGKVELTEEGKKVSEILLEKQKCMEGSQ